MRIYKANRKLGNMSELTRLSLSLEDSLCQKLDKMVQESGYRNRSEFIRDLLREKIVEQQWESSREVLATITLVYDHHQRELSDKLTRIQHDSPAHIMAGTHVHLSHEICAEMIMLKGRSGDIRELYFELRKPKGILHASISMSSTGEALN